MYYDQANEDEYLYRGRSVIASRNGISEEVVSKYYQYTILTEDLTKDSKDLRARATHNVDRMLELATWCDENCQGEWLIGSNNSGFHLMEDFIAFKLRWV